MFNLQPAAPAPHCDGADSKAWGIARRDSLSFLDHGIVPAPPAALLLPRSALPDLQTARSWGSLASQTLAMYPEVRLSACFTINESALLFACLGSTGSAWGGRRLRSPKEDPPSRCAAPGGAPQVESAVLRCLGMQGLVSADVMAAHAPEVPSCLLPACCMPCFTWVLFWQAKVPAALTLEEPGQCMQEVETLQCLPPICEKEMPPSELTVHTCIATPFAAWHKDSCQSDSDREAEMSWSRLPSRHDAHSPNALAQMQQAYHSEYAARQVGQLGQPAGSGSPNTSSSGTLQNLIPIPEGGPLQDADAVAAAFLVQGLQTEAGQHEMVGSPCPAPAASSEQQQQQQQHERPQAGLGAAGPGPAQAPPCRSGAATSPPVSPRASAAHPASKAASPGSPTSQLPATGTCSTQVWAATVSTSLQLSSHLRPLHGSADLI